MAPGLRRSQLTFYVCVCVCVAVHQQWSGVIHWPRTLQMQALQQAGRRRGVSLRVVEPPDIVRALLKVNF